MIEKCLHFLQQVEANSQFSEVLIIDDEFSVFDLYLAHKEFLVSGQMDNQQFYRDIFQRM